MNVDTGHLIRLREGQQAPEGYEQVPEEFSRAAKKKLAGKKEATVSMTSGGKLSSWAAKQRMIRKQMKETRRGNR